ncbi:MAG: YraN family protein [Methyloprofundus sp.]|nr:YraN family protein [Methyloprofundus sp.]
MVNFNGAKANTEALTRAQKGTQYEDLALKFLLAQGLKLITRNYRCKCGELDLLMDEKGALVIVEVRYRKNNRYGSALESVTKTKQARIIAATKYYIVTHKIDQPIRFDVLAITGESRPEWVKNAF